MFIIVPLKVAGPVVVRVGREARPRTMAPYRTAKGKCAGSVTLKRVRRGKSERSRFTKAMKTMKVHLENFANSANVVSKIYTVQPHRVGEQICTVPMQNRGPF